MALPVRSNLFAVYNVKNANGIGRWGHERQEASRVQRLAEVKASVQSRRPPKPQATSQNQAATRVPSSSSSSRKPVRARSASAHRSPVISEVEVAVMKYACRSSPDQLDAEIGNLLSLSRREMETQQYLTNADEAAAWKEEMQDWYFARNHNAAALRELNVGGYGQCDGAIPELQKVEHVVKPRSVRSDRSDRRRSPYALDLRQRPQASARPRSVPANLVGGRCESRARTQHHASAEKLEAQPEALKAEVARTETPSTRSPSKPDVQSNRSPAKNDVCEVKEVAPKENDKSPNLNSAAAIESWLSQANARMAEAFSNMPSVVKDVPSVKAGEAEAEVAVAREETSLRNSEELQEPVASSPNCAADNRVDSLSATGTTVYEPTTRPTSSVGSRTPAVGLSSKLQEAPEVRSPPGIQSAASLEMTYSQTELPAVSQNVQIEGKVDPTSSSSSRTEAQSVPVPASLAVDSTSRKAGGNVREASDSEHFSEDGFEEDGDDPYAAESFNASAVSAEVMSDRGSSRSEASLSDVPTRSICARAVEAVEEKRESSMSSSSILNMEKQVSEESRRSRSFSRGDSRRSLISCDEERRESSASSASISPGRREELGGSRSPSQIDKRNASNTAASYDEEYDNFDEDTSSMDG